MYMEVSQNGETGDPQIIQVIRLIRPNYSIETYSDLGIHHFKNGPYL